MPTIKEGVYSQLNHEPMMIQARCHNTRPLYERSGRKETLTESKATQSKTGIFQKITSSVVHDLETTI